jgi:hypothetical protein
MLTGVRGNRGILGPLACVAVATVLGSTGCGSGSSESRPTPLPVSTPASSVAISPTPRVDPASDEAVLAAARAYVAAVEVAARTGDPSEFRSITTADCNCRSAVEKIAEQLRKDGQSQDVRYRFVDPPRVVVRNMTVADVAVSIESEPYAVTNSSGVVIATHDPDGGKFVVSFRREGDSWVAFLVRNA